MAIPMGDNLSIKGDKPNVERDYFKTLSEMKNCNLNYYPNVFPAVCEETGKLYILNKKNTDDVKTGKWREVEGSGEVTAESLYEIVQLKSDLPADLSTADIKMFFVVEESALYLWNGTEYELQEETEDIDFSDWE